MQCWRIFDFETDYKLGIVITKVGNIIYIYKTECLFINFVCKSIVLLLS
jgi:hypothetical protein